MNNFGFLRAAAAIPFGKIADLKYNSQQIISLTREAVQKHASIIVFPELSLTSYTCGDLFFNSELIFQSLDCLAQIADQTRQMDILILLGLPVLYRNNLYNCAAVLNRGEILGIVPKSYIPNYREFYEIRWFTGADQVKNDHLIIRGKSIPFGKNLLFKSKTQPGLIVSAEICEDFWHPVAPSARQAQNGALVICNLSASNVLAGKDDFRKLLIKSQSAKTISAYIYASAGMGESTTDVVFDASGYIYENGVELSRSQRFLRKNQIIYADIDLERLIIERTRLNSFSNRQDDYEIIDFLVQDKMYGIERHFKCHPFVPDQKEKLDERCEEIFNIQSAALARRFETLPNTAAVIGLSGGLDSTLALLVVIKAFKLIDKDQKQLTALTMPGFGTTQKTYQAVKKLCRALDISLIERPIKDISHLVFQKIEHDPNQHDIVYENVQARARTYLLMTEANKRQGIVIGTGDLSEIALGWSTYNGDHISMYNVNCSIPKTLVKFLIQWVAEKEFKGEVKKILLDILNFPISPELLPSDGEKISQKTEEAIGPYELVDFFLYYFVRFGFSDRKILFLAENAFSGKYSRGEIQKWLALFFKRFFNSQWKRDCVPAGPKVGSIDLSPRGSWRMPTEVDWKNFVQEEESGQ